MAIIHEKYVFKYIIYDIIYHFKERILTSWLLEKLWEEQTELRIVGFPYERLWEVGLGFTRILSDNIFTKTTVWSVFCCGCKESERNSNVNKKSNILCVHAFLEQQSDLLWIHKRLRKSSSIFGTTRLTRLYANYFQVWFGALINAVKIEVQMGYCLLWRGPKCLPGWFGALINAVKIEIQMGNCLIVEGSKIIARMVWGTYNHQHGILTKLLNSVRK